MLAFAFLVVSSVGIEVFYAVVTGANAIELSVRVGGVGLSKATPYFTITRYIEPPKLEFHRWPSPARARCWCVTSVITTPILSR